MLDGFEPLENLPPSGPGLLAPGNPSGNDENPVLLRGVDGSLMAAYASDRNGPNDNEIFLLRSTDGNNWPAVPVQITDHPSEGNFYPAIEQQVNGFVHAVWWRRTVCGAFCARPPGELVPRWSGPPGPRQPIG